MGTYSPTRPNAAAARPRTHEATDRAFAVACVAALLLVLGAYANSLDNSFHFDDSHVVENNVYIRDLGNVPRFFTDAHTFSSTPANATYRPVISTTLALDYRLGGGLEPRAFHVTQLALLVLFGLLLLLVYRRVLASAGPSPWHRWAALFGATLFCVHTGNTQTVNYISSRSELLSGIGVLGTLLVYACAPRARRWQLHLLPMAFGALAKTPAVMAAPLLFAYDALIERQLAVGDLFRRDAWPRTRAALLATAPAFVAAAALYAFVEGMNPPGQSYGGGGRLAYLVTETWVWVRYAKSFVLPTGLSADTDLELFPSPWDPRVLAGIAFALVSVVVMVVASRRRASRPDAFGIAWFWIGLVPSSTVFPLAEVANDHRVFFPFAGLTLVLVSFGGRAFARAVAGRPRSAAPVWAAAAIGVLVLGAHAAGTHVRNRAWRSEETLWADCVRKSPHNARAWMNYGLTQMARGRYKEARAMFDRAATLTSNYATLEVNQAIADAALGDSVSADHHFARALELAPAHPASHAYYARWLVRNGRAAEAVVHFERALALSPANLEVRDRLLDLYAAAGSPRRAALAAETVALAPGDTIAAAHARGVPPFRAAANTVAAWDALGLARIGDARYADAAMACRAALAIDSTDVEAVHNLGWVLAKLGFFDEAIAWLDAAVRREPNSALAANNRAWAAAQVDDSRFHRAFALQRTGRDAEAVAVYRDLVARHPGWVNAHYNLGFALRATGQPAAAAREFARALELEPSLAGARENLAAAQRDAERAGGS